MEETQEKKHIVPLKEKLIFASGMFGTQIFNSMQGSSTAWFWLNIMGIDNIAYSIIMLVFYNIWNAVNDPVFGWYGDKTRTRWGRRVPFIRLFAPLWFVTNLFLFFPLVTVDIGLIIWFSVSIIAFDTCYTFIGNSYNALLGEISYDTTERAKTNTIAWVLGLLGNIIGLGVPLLVKENLFAFQIFILIGGLSGMIALLIPGLFVKERTIPPEETPLEIWSALKESLKNRPFLSSCFWYFSIEFTWAIIMSNAIFYATFIISVTGFSATLLLLAVVLAMLPGFVVMGKIQSKYGIRTTALISTVIYAFAMLGLFLAQDYLQTLLSFIIAGFGMSGPLMTRNVMIVESADYDEIRTNRRREGTFFGTNALLTKPAIGLAQAILATMLLITGFISDTVNPVTGDIIHHPQTDIALLGIRLVIGLFPFLFLLILGVVSVYFYPKKEEILDMKEQLKEVQKRKSQA